MIFKRFSALVLALSLALANSGCGKVEQPEEEKFLGTEIEKQASQSIDDVHLRDKKLLYANQDPTEVVTMYLTVSSGNSAENTDHTWEEINTYSVYDYESMGVERYKVEGLLQVGNENGVLAGELGYNQVSPNCTVQVRGQSSSYAAQKNYKIRLKDNKGQWRGQSTIALNKHVNEGLRFRNKMAYDLISGIDEMMGLRTTFVHLYVKDTTAGGNGEFQDYGIYTQVEQLNKTALAAHGLDKKGHLYKINICEFYRYEDAIKLKDDPEYDLKAFEEILEIKGDDDHEKLINMLERVNDYSIPIETILDENFDIENLSYWMAFQMLMGNIDTQNRNFYIYSPLNSEKWYIISWDNDDSLKRTEYGITSYSAQAGWEKGISNYWGNILFQRCLKSEKYRKALDSAVEDIKKYLTKERINDMVSKYSALVKPYVYRMPDMMYAPLTSEQYDTVANGVANDIETNYKLYKESYDNPMPFYIAVPEKKGEKLSFVWDNAYDFDAETITYKFELAKDYNFKEIIAQADNMKMPVTQVDMLPQGQYFIRVTAKNKSGKTQYAFDCYLTENGKIYGTKCFYVDESGKILEDVYVED